MNALPVPPQSIAAAIVRDSDTGEVLLDHGLTNKATVTRTPAALEAIAVGATELHPTDMLRLRPPRDGELSLAIPASVTAISARSALRGIVSSLDPRLIDAVNYVTGDRVLTRSPFGFAARREGSATLSELSSAWSKLLRREVADPMFSERALAYLAQQYPVPRHLIRETVHGGVLESGAVYSPHGWISYAVLGADSNVAEAYVRSLIISAYTPR